jgi:hypothetical protein
MEKITVKSTDKERRPCNILPTSHTNQSSWSTVCSPAKRLSKLGGTARDSYTCW